MLVTLDNRIRLAISGLDKGFMKRVREEFKHNNPQFYKMRAMGRYTGNIQSKIATFDLSEDGKELSLPRGVMPKLVKLLEEQGLKIDEQVDNRKSGVPVQYEFSKDITLRDYQVDAVDAILKSETCLIQGAAGSGKTEIVLAAIARIGLKAIIIVNETKLFNQWIERIEVRLGIPKKEIGKVGAGNKFKIGEKVTVAMQQTAKNQVNKLCEQFGAFFLDECHHSSAKTFLALIDQFTAKYRAGFSATIKRQDLKQFLTHDMFGEIALDVSRSDLEDQGYLVPVELHVVPTKFEYDYLNRNFLIGLGHKRGFEIEDLNSEQRRKLCEKFDVAPREYPQYLTAVGSDIERNNLIYYWVKRELEKGSSCILFTKRREQCELWRDVLANIGIEVSIFWSAQGSKAEEERMATDLVRFKSGQVRVAIGTTVDEALDLPLVDTGFVTYRNATNPGQLAQQAGRLARLFKGKKEARLYYFWDRLIPKFSDDTNALRKHFRKMVVHEGPKR